MNRQLLMDKRGIYRDVNVYISGTRHTPPGPLEMYRQIKDFYLDLQWKEISLNPIELVEQRLDQYLALADQEEIQRESHGPEMGM